jgi:hypothetical protein
MKNHLCFLSLLVLWRFLRPGQGSLKTRDLNTLYEFGLIPEGFKLNRDDE